jgi:hypothetical protein
MVTDELRTLAPGSRTRPAASANNITEPFRTSAAAAMSSPWSEDCEPANPIRRRQRRRQRASRATHPGIDTNVLYTHALAENVTFVPSSVLDPSGELRTAMRLNFTRTPPEVLADGVLLLERAVRKYLAA